MSAQCQLLLYSHDTTIQIYRCREIRNTDDSPLFRYETFINFMTFSFSTREQRHNFYDADCSYIAHSQPFSWTGPAQCQISTNFFFLNHQILCLSLPGMTSFTPQSYFLSRVFMMTFVIVILCARAWTVLNVCTPALIAE